MTCPQCGEAVSEHDWICPHCHYRLATNDEEPTIQGGEPFEMHDSPIWPTDPRAMTVGTTRARPSAAAPNLGLLLAGILIACGVVGLLAFVVMASSVFGRQPETTNGQIAAQITATPLPTMTALPTATDVPTVTIVSSPTPDNGEVAINSGGNADGIYQADMDYSGGATFTTGAVIDTSAVPNPAPQSAYQTERYGTFSYLIGNLKPNAVYKVRLHFAELYFTKKGERDFDVAINNHIVLHHFDIIAKAGGIDKAIVREFSVMANGNGQITIAYLSGAANNPKSSAIEIIPNN